jgi:hypothetical protein
MEDFDTTKSKADRSIEVQRSKLQHVLRRITCVQCKAKVLEGDLLDLKCTQTVKHLHCFDCIRDILERQKGFNERLTPEVRKQYPLLDSLVICSQCHHPAVVSQTSACVTGFSQRATGAGGRVQYQLLEAKSGSVRAETHVAEYYQNQRRGPFSKFKDKLLPTDGRGLKSTKDGKPVEEARTLEGEVWLNDWRWDSQIGDPQGWQYAFTWPENSMFKWVTWVNAPASSAWIPNNTYVRRRRMIRTKIKLIPELQEAGDPSSPSEKRGTLDPLATPRGGVTNNSVSNFGANSTGEFHSSGVLNPPVHNGNALASGGSLSVPERSETTSLL